MHTCRCASLVLVWLCSHKAFEGVVSNIYHGHASMLSKRCLFGLASRCTRWMQCPAFVAMIRIVSLLTYQLVTQLQLFVCRKDVTYFARFAARIYRRQNMCCPVNKASGCLDLPLPPYPSPASDLRAPSHRAAYQRSVLCCRRLNATDVMCF